MKNNFFAIFAMIVPVTFGFSQEPPGITKTENLLPFDVVAHDPVIVEEGGVYYLFTTGPGVSVWTSDDFQRWTMSEPVFDPLPTWTNESVVGFKGHMWAPDVSYRNGKYYLYYSVSAFGKNDSCIGLATNVTLNATIPDFEWVDEGIVLRSDPGIDDWNAIDPNLVIDKDGTPYMAFGSFWSGLKIAKLNDSMTRLAEPDRDPLPIASRVKVINKDPDTGEVILGKGNTAIEGPFIYRRGDFYYLFASIDFCCRGIDSTYRMIVGRSEELLGPYLDKGGNRLLDGGGTVLKSGSDRWHGLGHNSICKFDGVEYLVFHGYDGSTEHGLPKLHIEELSWTEEQWPYLAEAEQ